MQSCERSDSDLTTIEQKPNNMKVLNNKEPAKNESSEVKRLDNLETGDDDEPKRDKQHWRMVQDTI